MLAIAAAELGFRSHIYAPAGDNPAADVAHAVTIADWQDEAALAEFGDAIDVATYEFENIPEETVRYLAERAAIHPNADALAIAQDRLAEKTMATSLGLAVAPYMPVDTFADLEAAIARIGASSILKTRRLGYDGKGQAAINGPEDAASAWEAIGAAPAVLERRVAFQTEISVILARSQGGETRAFDIPENRHADGILSTSTVPASIHDGAAETALATATQIADALDYVGVLAVEMFLNDEGADLPLLVNEIAPRVHNSGHWTQDACVISQFEQHIRAICGWPLGDPSRHSDVTMTNLIGHDVDRWRDLSAETGANLHLYGKGAVRPGRKMGHMNALRPRTR